MEIPSDADQGAINTYSTPFSTQFSGGENPTAPLFGIDSGSLPPREATFEFHRVLAKGGYGAVWEGIQERLRRVVAIKRMREDLVRTSSLVADRLDFLKDMFREEALTAAHLDHPNIVPVYDLARDSDDLPMLAMKLMKGRSWDEELEADFASLPVEDFLARHIPILHDVAQAVAFAHSRGIIHRDLKASQVMLGEYGEVRLMDWGLAVNFDESLLHETVGVFIAGGTPTKETATNPAGTPAFMAPEQTDPTAANVGPWTDVYLLGATLYHLLTGKAPHEGGVAQAFAMASRGEYRPLAEAAPGRFMPQELITLVTESLIPAVERRILTAREFTDRLRDYLSGNGRRQESQAITNEVKESLDAGVHEYEPLGDIISALGRAQTLWPSNPDGRILRQRALAVFAETALHHGDHVLARVQAMRMEEDTRRTSLLSQLHVAEARAVSHARTRRMALRAVLGLGTVIVLGSLIFLHRLGQEAQERQLALNTALVAKSAAEHARTDAITASADADDLVTFIVADIGEQLGVLGRLDILDTAYERARQYADSHPAVTMKAVRNRMVVMRQLADLRNVRGDLNGALAFLAVAAKYGETYLSSNSDDMDIQRESASIKRAIGMILIDQGKLPEAREMVASALLVHEELCKHVSGNTMVARDLFIAYDELSAIDEQLGELEQAADEVDKGFQIVEKLVATDQKNLLWQDDLAYVYTRVAQIMTLQGRLDEALVKLQQALSMREALAASDPTNMVWLRQVGHTSNSIGYIYERQAKPDLALDAYQRDLAVKEQLAAFEPENMDWLHSVSSSLIDVAAMMTTLDKFDQAKAVIERAIHIAEKVSKADPSNKSWRGSLGGAYEGLGSLLENSGQYAEALAAYEKHYAIAKELADDQPGNSLRLENMATSLARLSSVNESLENLDEALRRRREALALHQRLVDSEASNKEWQSQLEDDYSRLGHLLLQAGRIQEAREYFEKRFLLTEKRSAGEPDSLVILLEHARSWKNMGDLERAAGNLEKALAAYERVQQLAETRIIALSGDSSARGYLEKALDGKGRTLAALGRKAEAREAFTRCLPLEKEEFGEDSKEVREMLEELKKLDE